MISLDLPPAIEQRLVDKAHHQGISLETYIISLLSNEIDNELKDENLAWQHGKHVFGIWESGDGTLSQNAKSTIKQAIQAKHGKHTH